LMLDGRTKYPMPSTAPTISVPFTPSRRAIPTNAWTGRPPPPPPLPRPRSSKLLERRRPCMSMGALREGGRASLAQTRTGAASFSRAADRCRIVSATALVASLQTDIERIHEALRKFRIGRDDERAHLDEGVEGADGLEHLIVGDRQGVDRGKNRKTRRLERSVRGERERNHLGEARHGRRDETRVPGDGERLSRFELG